MSFCQGHRCFSLTGGEVVFIRSDRAGLSPLGSGLLPAWQQCPTYHGRSESWASSFSARAPHLPGPWAASALWEKHKGDRSGRKLNTGKEVCLHGARPFTGSQNMTFLYPGNHSQLGLSELSVLPGAGLRWYQGHRQAVSFGRLMMPGFGATSASLQWPRCPGLLVGLRRSSVHLP